MSEEESSKENAQLPQTYAGLKYYDIITTTMTMNRDAMLMGDYQRSSTLLFEYFNSTSPAMKPKDSKKIKDMLCAVQKSIDLWENKRFGSGVHIGIITKKLRDELREIQYELYNATKHLMMKYSTGDDGELDFTLLSRGG